MPVITLAPTGTTYVDSLIPDNNFSSIPLMPAGVNLDTGEHFISFIKFDTPAIPPGSVISATLELFVYTKEGTDPSIIDVSGVTSNFDINTVTFNTMPAFGPPTSSAIVNLSDVFTFKAFDVTDVVQGWVNGIHPNYGFAITNETLTTLVYFTGAAAVPVNIRPYLTIEYGEAPIGPTGPTGATGPTGDT